MNVYLRKKTAMNNKGFTLIETIVAIAILTTGILGGLALAVYALGASDVALKQIIATHLAREGIEAVRSRRDRNWNECNNWQTCADIGPGQYCCRGWSLNIPSSVAGTNSYVTFTGTGWSINSSNNWDNYRLYLDPNTGRYVPAGLAQNLRFYRRLAVYTETAAPFSNNNPRLRIVSTVWWIGRGCPNPPNPASPKCKVMIESYLTNWKDYESPL